MFIRQLMKPWTGDSSILEFFFLFLVMVMTSGVNHVETVKNVPARMYLNEPDIKMIIDEHSYLDKDDNVVFWESNVKFPFLEGMTYHFNARDNLLYKVSLGRIDVEMNGKTIMNMTYMEIGAEYSRAVAQPGTMCKLQEGNQ